MFLFPVLVLTQLSRTVHAPAVLGPIVARTRSFVSAAVGVVTLGEAKVADASSLNIFDEDLDVGRLALGGYREGGAKGPKSLAQMYIDRFNGRQPRELGSAPRLMLGARSTGATDDLTSVVTITSKRVRPDYTSGRASRSGWSITPTVMATPAGGNGSVAVPHHVDNAVVMIPALKPTRVAFTALSRLSSDDGETCASEAPEPLGLPGTPIRKSGVGESALAQTLPASPGVAHVEAASGDVVDASPKVFAGQLLPVPIIMRSLVTLSTTADIALPSLTDVPLVHIDLDQGTAIALAPLRDGLPEQRPPKSQGTVTQAAHVTAQVFEHRRDSIEAQTLLTGGDSFNVMHANAGTAQRPAPCTTHRSVPRRLPITQSDCVDLPTVSPERISLCSRWAAAFRSQTWRIVIGHIFASVIEYTTAAPFLDVATEWGIQLTLTTNLVSIWHAVLCSPGHHILAYLPLPFLQFLQAHAGAWYAIVAGTTIALITAALAAQGAITGVTQVAALTLVAAFTFLCGLLMRLVLAWAQRDPWHSHLFRRGCTTLLVVSYASCAAVLVWPLPSVASSVAFHPSTDSGSAVRDL